MEAKTYTRSMLPNAAPSRARRGGRPQNGGMKKTPLDPSFAGLGLDARLVRALAALGYEEPTPIQSASIPPMLESRDVLAQAATGTGKTAAFALPILHRIGAAEKRGTAPMALVLVPTRELAMQLAEAFHRYGREIGVRVLPVYGGASMVAQLNALKRGVDVVVATPGRALDHVNRRSLALDGLVALVLDEADEMLDMGFLPDVEAIVAQVPAVRQTMLFSATMPSQIVALARRYMTRPTHVRAVDPHDESATVDTSVSTIASILRHTRQPSGRIE